MRKLMTIAALGAACALGSLAPLAELVAAQEIFQYDCFIQEDAPALSLEAGDRVYHLELNLESVDQQYVQERVKEAKETVKQVEQAFGVKIKCGQVE